MSDIYAKTPLFIDAEEMSSSTGEAKQLRNPANIEEVVGEFARASLDDVDRAIEAAAGALRLDSRTSLLMVQPQWTDSRPLAA